MIPDRAGRRAAWLLAATILIFAPVSFAYNGLLSHARPSLKNDFTSYYVAGLALREGRPDALYYPEPVGSLLAQASEQRPWIDLARPAGIDHPNYYLYPPLFAVLFAPLTVLPYRTAYLAWEGIGALCLLFSTALALSTYAASPRRSVRALLAAPAAVLVACLFYPVSRTFAVGQSSLLLLLLMTGAMVGLTRRTRAGDALGGWCLAGGIMLKLTPVIFLPWLAMRRRWKALGWSVIGLAALAAISVAAVGIEPHRIYMTRMVAMLSGGTAFYPNQSIAGLVARAAGEPMRLADLVDPASGPALIARALGGLLLLASLAVAARRRDEERGFCLLVMAGLAASPISWEHHYVLALLPAWVLIREASSPAGLSTRRAAVTGVALALCGSYVGLRVIEGFGGGLAAQVISSAGLAGGLLLWGLLALPARRPDAEPGGPKSEAPGGLLVLMAVFAAGVFSLKLIEYNRSYGYGDFTSYYVAAATLIEGEGRPLYYPDTPDMILARAETPSDWTQTAERWGVEEANYYLYPPFFAMAMVPLALVRYGAAHDLWYIANLAALAGCLWLLTGRHREGGGDDSPAATRVTFAVLAVVLSWPSLFTFGAGQANFVVLLCLLWGLDRLMAGREAAAGLLLAGAVAVKMTPGLLLLWLAWRRRWKALGTACVSLATLAAAGAIVAGTGSYRVYVEEMIPLLSRGCAHWVNEAPAAFFTRLVDGAGMFSWEIADPSAASRGLSALASLLAIGIAFAVIGLRRPPRESDEHRRERLGLEFSLMVVTTLFVSPISWTHHSVLSIVGFVLAATALVRRDRVTTVTVLAFATAYTLVNVHVKPPGLLERDLLNALASYNLAGNVLLWGLLIRLLRSAPRESSPAGARA